MKRKRQCNNGFTLIELIISIAILAFLMTAVSAFMLSGVMSSRKAKADIAVHNTAQDVYDQLANSIMSSNDVFVYAYVIDGAMAGGDKSLSFAISDKDVGETMSGPIYFVRDEAQADALKVMPEYVNGTEIKYFSDLNDNVRLYVKQLIVDNSVEIDMSYVSSPIGDKYTNSLTGEQVKIEEQAREVDTDGSKSSDKAQDQSGSTVYTVKDTQRNIFSFDSKNMYYETKYAYMTGLDDYSAGTDKSKYLYSRSFAYLNDGTDTVTGCVLTVDSENGSFGIDLYFSDKNMTYTTLGMINTRNSYVLRAKK